MEFVTQNWQLILQGVILVFNIILLITLFIKRKNAKTSEEKTELDEIIKNIMPTAIAGIKKLCQENGVNYNKKETVKQTKKLIKESTNGEEI